MARTESKQGAALLDVNVLLALLDQQHVNHRQASHWLANNIERGWATCPLTQNGCIRVLSQPSYPGSVPLISAMETLASVTQSAHHVFWPDCISLLDAEKFHRSQLHGHRQLTDAYLLGLAVSQGGRFVTFDARIALSSVLGAGPEHLVVI